ncbi:MAG: DUF4231 domain-containing protein [Candidatus Nitrosopolaris sp.]
MKFPEPDRFNKDNAKRYNMKLGIRRYLGKWSKGPQQYVTYQPQEQRQEQSQSQQNLGSNFSENYDIDKAAEISDYIQKRFLPVFHYFKNRTHVTVRRLHLWRVSIIVLTLFIVIFDVSLLGYYDGGPFSSATAIASSIAAVLVLGSTAFVQLTRTQENLLLFSTASRMLEREYQLFMLKAGVYSPSAPSTTNIDEDYKAKSKLFVERIEDIIFNHSSESRFQYPSALNQLPSDHMMISKSGKQTETSNGKKIGVNSLTDKIKENVTDKSIKEGLASTVGKETT